MARPSFKTTNVLRVGLAVLIAFVVTTVKADQGTTGPGHAHTTLICSTFAGT